jgi:hypothetical protein
LETSVLDTLLAYWRIKAAIAIYRGYSAHGELGIKAIGYDNVPQHGHATAFLQKETVAQATDAIDRYIEDRLARDLLLALIAHFESFLGYVLAQAGQAPSGTLGNLQASVQGIHTIPQGTIDDFDEVRERRNALIHDHGQIGQRYRNAATKVFARSSGWVTDPATITVIDVPPGYLSYVGDIVVSYARAIP